MRRIAWGLLLALAFAIPWEYSLDMGEPFGNIARLTGILLLLAGVPAVLQAGRLRTPSAFLWVVLAYFLWFCCSYFWTIDPIATLERMRSYFQELVIVWLLWEFAESAEDLRWLMTAYVVGAWVLAWLTLADFSSGVLAGQFRFVAEGQDPNDVARFLDLAFPFAALLMQRGQHPLRRLVALGYFPVGLTAVILTASRGGFLAVTVALGGCALLLGRNHARWVWSGIAALPVISAGLWLLIPHETLERLATIPQQLQSGDLNQRMNIWTAGWDAFVRAPVVGSGAGSFAGAAMLNPLDTAHNTALSIGVDGGLIALLLAVLVALCVLCSLAHVRGALFAGLATALSVWVVASLAATVEENRATWLLLGMVAVAGRLAQEEPERVNSCFEAKETLPIETDFGCAA